MKSKDLNVVLAIFAFIGLVAFLAISANVMKEHPALPWFGFGVLATLGIEAIAFGIYQLVIYFKSRK